jgi:hypothetical protein
LSKRKVFVPICFKAILNGAYVLAGELAAASGDHLRAFAEYERVMRPFVEANQALGLRSSKIMRSGETKSVHRLAPEAFDADSAGTRDGVAYQSLHRADHHGGQRNLPEGLFVLFEIKSRITNLARKNYFLLLNFYFVRVRSWIVWLTDSLCVDSKL